MTIRERQALWAGQDDARLDFQHNPYVILSRLWWIYRRGYKEQRGRIRTTPSPLFKAC